MTRWAVIRNAALGAAVGLSLAACSGGMSAQVREEAVPVASFQDLLGNVDAYQGRTVILGGEIIEVRNESMEETTLLVLQRPLGFDRRPQLDHESGGRFMVRFDRYLDPEVFRKGMAVTVGGVVQGTVVEPVGKAQYRYVVLQARDLRGWRRSERTYYGDPFYGDPFYRGYPYWSHPYWGHPYWFP